MSKKKPVKKKKVSAKKADALPPDKISELLDQNEVVVLFRNGIGSITAASLEKGGKAEKAVRGEVAAMSDLATTHTDGWTSQQALDALADKRARRGMYANWPPKHLTGAN